MADKPKADHVVTLEWHDYSFSPTESLTCKADPGAFCHAVWDCECESWDEHGIEDGVPWHGYSSDDGDVRHFGRLDPTECNLVNWFENSEEVMRGSVTFPVVATFDGDYYTFAPEDAS